MLLIYTKVSEFKQKRFVRDLKPLFSKCDLPDTVV